ncbi:T9SS type A sorting domain-containing protein [Luteibaculum oceani]|uniref:T9SS type A sorting domain-containing protein n=1 Tax=Luteibaculum oceani TaxID=1294296 RepID=A0A5C6VCT5_9FLAO|nr:T9SS type A sorting domain-containing protein [Luteibaculum oceani]TXC81375.1 T9SS type A sorting domain-containing protein [Luteibaculum oceani]
MEKLFTSFPLKLFSLILLVISSFPVIAQQDTIAPVARCRNVEIELNEYGVAYITATMVDNGSYDNTVLADLELDITQFDCADLGENQVTLTATDSAGNQASCYATVTVTEFDLGMLVKEGFEILVRSNLVYENDFENPAHTNFRNCAPDFAQNLVRDLYGDGFDQMWTVETMQINGPEGQYSDPQGLGGNYCLGMLSTVQDDKIAFTFDRKDLDYVNLNMIVSAIDVPRCGGPFGVNVPKFNFKLYDTPSQTWDFGNPGRLLDEGEAEGTVPGADPYTFNWSEIDVDLDASTATNGFVTLLIDQLNSSGYAAIDNLSLSSSTDSNKFVNQLFVDEADTAWLQGTFTPGAAGDAVITASMGVAAIDNAAGEWSWYYVSNDGPDNSTDVTVSISAGCSTEDFNFELIVRDVAPVPTVNSDTVFQDICVYATNSGTFSDVGLDVVTISASSGQVTQDNDSAGNWFWTATEYYEALTQVTITATDEDGLDSTITFMVDVAPWTLNPSCENVTITLGENGLATLNPAQLWSDYPACMIAEATLSQSQFDCGDVGEHNITLYLTDIYGNSDSCSSVVNVEQTPLVITGEVSEYGSGNVSCFGASDGFIDATVDGGCGNYTYLWSNGATTQDLNNIPAGTYTLRVIDGTGASAEQTFVLENPERLDASIEGDKAVYVGYGPNECIDIYADVNGGDAPYTYLWNTGSTASSISDCPTQSTTYTVTVTDANGCSVTVEKEICIVDVTCGKPNNPKVIVCHNGKNMICVDESAVAAHLAHGDYLGGCEYKDPCNPSIIIAGTEGDGEEEGEENNRITLSEGEGVVENPELVSKSSVSFKTGSLSLYPNPFNASINLAAKSEVEGDWKVEVLDAAGKLIALVLDQKLKANQPIQLKINSDNLTPGVLFIKVSSPTEITINKVVYQPN